jgi:xanthine dehydrogenase accessory factor
LNIYAKAEEYLKEGTGGVIATIVRKVGATPRQAGAKIFIGGDGKIFGTIGGGCVEAEVWQESRRIINTERVKLLHFAMNGSAVEDEGMICGGSIDLFLEPILQKHAHIYRAIGDSAAKGDPAVMITTFSSNGFTKSLLLREDAIIGDPLPAGLAHGAGKYLCVTKPVFGDGLIVEPISRPSRLFIFGAGHISRYISMTAKIAEFNVTVIDDRESFANKERFPEADEIIVEDFQSVFKHLSPQPGDYAVIVTRGHSHDALVLGEVLKNPCRYVGMIGSKRKTRIVFDHLRTAGVLEEALQKVHAPIGINIDAETPQEIAISIVAEMIKAKRGGKVAALLRDAALETEPIACK